MRAVRCPSLQLDQVKAELAAASAARSQLEVQVGERDAHSGLGPGCCAYVCMHVHCGSGSCCNPCLQLASQATADVCRPPMLALHMRAHSAARRRRSARRRLASWQQ